MGNLRHPNLVLPPEQQTIRDKCLLRSGTFVEFIKEEVKGSIPERFEKIVRRYPDRVAVKMGPNYVTYGSLNVMANSIARAILAHHVSASEPIGLLFAKSITQIAGMLGVLKAGRIFVLLDSSFPQDRIATVLDNSGAGTVLADQHSLLLANQGAGKNRTVIQLEAISDPDAAEDLRLRIPCEAVGYIVYTSGSTGQPKGVMKNHQNLLHSIRLRVEATPVYIDDKIALLPSGTGNMVTHTFFALLNGASLLPFDVQRNGVNHLPNWLLEEKITFLPISPSLFRNVCENLTGNERFPDLRLLRVGSETARRTDVELYRKYFSPDCLMFNALNSSEAGVLRLFFINHNTEIAEPEVPAGYPVEDKEIFLLDDSGREVGYNEIGEIVVRSHYLSPGYWRNPELTAAKFKDDPQGGGCRLYFTGDLGLTLPDGCLVMKGRKDFRVKIRGYGVEIAEVENGLRQHPKIKEVVVVARKNDLREDYLIAYFISLDGGLVSPSELRSFLKRRFPDYMIPSRFILLKQLPLTSRGKIDRQGLPDPGKSRPEIDTPYMAPRTAIEEQLAQIWAEVLSVNQVGIHDDFFDLGGHSLAASKIIARVIQWFQLELPVTALFDSPTVMDMAALILANEMKRASERDLDRMLREVEVMSEEEAMQAFANTTGKTSEYGNR